ncbi:hypothetical protein [Pseudoalteromonas sp.]|jgi:hypothetical protein|uniref:hypothetical protein n=1 Tax=Pseudoalteromonas sp. TaxID=53249 RepID=UPI0035665658
MSDSDINNLNSNDDAAEQLAAIAAAKRMAIDEILKEKRLAIAEIRAEMDVAIDEILCEAENTDEGLIVNDMAEAVKRKRKQGKRDSDRRARDADYDSHEQKHREA